MLCGSPALGAWKFSRSECSGFRLYVTIFDEPAWDCVACISASRSTATHGPVWAQCNAVWRHTAVFWFHWNKLSCAFRPFWIYFIFLFLPFGKSMSQVNVLRSILIASIDMFRRSLLITNHENVRPICFLPTFPKILSILRNCPYTMWQLMCPVEPQTGECLERVA
jgi:hypothetical protein